jgi:hypothetical protein
MEKNYILDLKYKEKYLKYKTKYIQLKNQFGGQKIKNLFRDIQKSNNIYTINSHGCDSEELLDVPDNCIYVTFGLSGSTVPNDFYRQKFIKMFSENHPLLKDPVNNLSKLQDIFNIDVHIHYKDAKDPNMRKYLNPNYDCFLGWYMNDKYTALKSGLYSIGTNINQSEIILNNTVTEDNIKYLYTDSLYPTFDSIKNIGIHNANLNYTHFEFNIKNMFKVDQATLFHYFPGIHYNYACRVDCSNINNPSKIHQDRRFASFRGNLVERGINFDENDKNIHYYLKHKNFDKVKELIEKNNNLEILNEEANTPLYVCCFNRYYDIAKLLIEKGVKLDKKAYNICMMRGVNGNPQFYDYLLSKGLEEIKKNII